MDRHSSSDRFSGFGAQQHVQVQRAESSASFISSEEMINETMDQIKMYAPSEFEEITSNMILKEQVTKEITEVHELKMKLSQEFPAGREYSQTEVEQKMKKIFSDEEYFRIKKGLKIPTVKLNMSPDNLDITILDSEGMAPLQIRKPLATSAECGNYIQQSSILVEGMLLFVSMAEQLPPFSSESMKKTLEKSVDFIKTTGGISSALMKCVESWTVSGNSIWKKAYSLAELMVDLFKSSCTVFLDIIKGLFKTKSSAEWIMCCVRLVAFFGSYINPLVPVIVSSAADAVDFALKFKNVEILQKYL